MARSCGYRQIMWVQADHNHTEYRQRLEYCGHSSYNGQKRIGRTELR
ncbi:MAG: hypothetical protein ACTTK0_06395 [Stomatobaculum sp.]